MPVVDELVADVSDCASSAWAGPVGGAGGALRAKIGTRPAPCACRISSASGDRALPCGNGRTFRWQKRLEMPASVRALRPADAPQRMEGERLGFTGELRKRRCGEVWWFGCARDSGELRKDTRLPQDLLRLL